LQWAFSQLPELNKQRACGFPRRAFLLEINLLAQLRLFQFIQPCLGLDDVGPQFLQIVESEQRGYPIASAGRE
jgi:hypothetical protein